MMDGWVLRSAIVIIRDWTGLDWDWCHEWRFRLFDVVGSGVVQMQDQCKYVG